MLWRGLISDQTTDKYPGLNRKVAVICFIDYVLCHLKKELTTLTGSYLSLSLVHINRLFHGMIVW